MFSRRSFVTALVAAPAVIAYGRLMPVAAFDPLDEWSSWFGSGDFTLEMWLRPASGDVDDLRITKGIARPDSGRPRTYFNGVLQAPPTSGDWQHVHVVNDRRAAAKILRSSLGGDALRGGYAPDRSEVMIS